MMSEWVCEFHEPGSWAFEQKEEIVRCRDCKHYEETDTMFGFDNTCNWWAEEPTVDPDGFCAWGERREND